MGQLLGYFFRFQGKVGRKPYLAAWSVSVLLEFIASAAAVGMVLLDPDLDRSYAIAVFALLMIPPYLSQLAFAARRLRDAGESSYLCLFGPTAFLVMLGLAVIFNYGALVAHFIDVPDDGSGANIVFANTMIISTVLVLLAPVVNQLVYLLFLIPGTAAKEEAAEGAAEEVAVTPESQNEAGSAEPVSPDFSKR